jgi:acetyltransferase
VHFAGPLWPVNPHHDELDGVRVFHRLRHLPAAPELAVVATPAAAVAAVVAELAQMGTRTALVLSPGMNAAQRQAMLTAGQRHRLRILGPDRGGLIVPHWGLNASLTPLGALPGELALLSQSHALATAMLDWANARGIGFSQVVMLGERADIDVSDWLDHLGSDARTRAILVYMEQPEEARKFLSASRERHGGVRCDRAQRPQRQWTGAAADAGLNGAPAPAWHTARGGHGVAGQPRHARVCRFAGV